jgi:hypothetical protein
VNIKEKLFIYFLGLVVILQVASILNNSYGRYNISKTCLTAGFFNLVLAILFFWTLHFVDQGLGLAAQVYNKPGEETIQSEF